jgi:hypothetical protein
MITTKTATVDPTVSIIMTIVDGGLTLRNALTAIAASTDPPPLDVIVPFDNSVGEVATFAGEFPDVHFLAMGQVATEHPIQSDAGQHELFDQRRAAGLAAAKGDIITILEDRGQAHPDWARNVVRVHAEKPNYVIGGAVELRTPAPLLNWAVYICDFSRYGLPLPKHPVEWVTDVNVSYKRVAIEETRHLWAKKYQEPVVHWALRNTGQELIFSDDLVVEHHRHLKGRFLSVLAEKFSWGRLFGEIRVRNLGLAERLKLIAMGPIIPFVLLVRHGKTQTSKGRFWRFLMAAPLLLILLIVWTAGEVWGYVTKKA